MKYMELILPKKVEFEKGTISNNYGNYGSPDKRRITRIFYSKGSKRRYFRNIV